MKSQVVEFAHGYYDHLASLELADPGELAGEMTIDILIGPDHYWSIATGRVIKCETGPTAIETRLGWVLSDPVDGLPAVEAARIDVVNTCSTHLLKIDTCYDDISLERGLQRFWKLQITLEQGRYEVSYQSIIGQFHNQY